MPEKIDERTIFSLFEVTKSIQKTINKRYTSAYWVKAEMNKLNYYKQSGHCYPELVEKKEGKIIAQIKSNLWKDDYKRINDHFIKTLNEPLKEGIKILILSKISFEPVYGLSLRIIDIDPNYTLGDLEKEKQETIKKLREEGVFNKNKQLKLPLLPQRIAIISVDSSKGYADFIKVLDTNSWNYKFFHFLFPALLQGDRAVQSILTELNKIKRVKHHFDGVAIIRGGGGDIGLSCYNNYLLAKEISLFPLPVITGIGHATNETVVEMVSFHNAITPTKLAEFLIQKYHNFSVPVKEAEKKMIDNSKRLLNNEKTRFNSEIKFFRTITSNKLLSKRNEIKLLTDTFLREAKFIFKSQNENLLNYETTLFRGIKLLYSNAAQKMKDFIFTMHKDLISQLNQHFRNIDLCKIGLNTHSKLSLAVKRTDLINLEKNISNMSPDNVLKRGYSITMLNGKAVKNALQVKSGDALDTRVFEGSIKSIVSNINSGK